MENIDKVYTTKLPINGKTYAVDVYKIEVKDKFKEQYTKFADELASGYGLGNMKISTRSFMCVMKIKGKKIESYGITSNQALSAMKDVAADYIMYGD